MNKGQCSYLWVVSKVPEIKDLDGKFNVKILTGICKILNRIYPSWEKTIINSSGHNILNGKKVGHFIVTAPPPIGIPESELCFNYNQSLNTNFWNKMIDTIRMYKPGVFIGKVYLKIYDEKYKFLNHFTTPPEYKFLGFFALVEKSLVFDKKTFSVIEPKVEYYPKED